MHDCRAPARALRAFKNRVCFQEQTDYWINDHKMANKVKKKDLKLKMRLKDVGWLAFYKDLPRDRP